MSLFKWLDEYSVDVEIIDKHHKNIVDYINELHDAIQNKESYTVTGEVLKKLVNYTKFHFKFEEDYFEKFNYENTSDHIEKHIKFINELIILIEKFSKEDLFVSKDTISFLRDWLINHIGKEDKKYVKCFHEHGLH
jgi:hemerythrin